MEIPVNFTEIPIILLYKITCSEFLLSLLFEECGILIFKYLNKIHNFDEKVIILLISTLTGKTVFKNLLKTEEEQARCMLSELLYWDSEFEKILLLSLCFGFGFFFLFFFFGQCFSLMHQSQSRLRQLILSHKKITTNVEIFLGIPCSG